MKKNIFYLLIICIVLMGNAVLATPRLMIKIPTRSRPVQFFKMLDLYYEYLSGEVPYLFVITCDSDDATMNNPAVIEQFKKYPNLYAYFGTSTCKVQAYNQDIDKHINECDIILVASDDMEPMVHSYDKIIVQYMLESFPDFDGVLNFYDGIRGGELNTLPIVGKKYYQRFGYVYYPSYTAFFCDNEFTEVSKLLRRERICYEMIIRHNYPGHGANNNWDELYERYSKGGYGKLDSQTFFQRQQEQFGLKKKEHKPPIVVTMRHAPFQKNLTIM